MEKSDIFSYDFCYGGVFSTSEAWIHSKKTEPNNEIIIVTDGTIYLTDDGENFTLSGGDYIVLKEGTTHKGHKISTGKTSFFWLHFTGSVAGLPKMGSVSNLPSVIRSAQHVLELHRNGKYPPDAVNAMLFVLLCELKAEPLTSTDPLTDTVCEYIRSHAYKPITVKSVADGLGYNPDYLTKVLKKSINMSLQQKITDERMNYAKYLLQNSALSVSAIASQMGFPDLKAFLKFFKYHGFSTPKEYRNSFSAVHTNHK